MSKYLPMVLTAALAMTLVARSSDRVHADAPADGAATAKKTIAIGDPAPQWKELEGVDGKRHSLGDLKKAKAVVVVFTCNHCPVAKAYEDRVVALAEEFKEQGVAFVAINVNNIEDDKLPAMKERAKEKGFKFAYLYDPSQKIGRAFAASVTPHAFVLDKDRHLVYRGAIDDNMETEKVTKHFVHDAVTEVLAGKKVTVAETKPSGCGIQYE